MYDYIRPDKVINALQWLKANNPLYADISINDEWLNDSIANKSELFNSLTKQPDELESGINTTAKCTKQMVQIDDTISPLTRIAKENGYIIHDVPGDGDCLFSSIACQLQSYNIVVKAKCLTNNSIFSHSIIVM